MSFQNCPYCGLSIRVRANFPGPGHCPRCIARRKVAVPMYGTDEPARLTADRLFSRDADQMVPRAHRPSPRAGADTAA